MIIQETVIIVLNKNNFKHYESIGYFIPKYFNQSKLKFKRGTMLKVKISDLQKGSHVKVLCKCDECGKENLVVFKTIKNNYLCLQCSRNTKEYKEKQRKVQTGKKLSEETKQKISKNNKTKKGKEHPMWNSKLTNKERKRSHHIIGIEPWKRKVKERDNYTCQKCGYVGKRNDGFMIAHHIDNFSDFKEQRTNIENGITLCKNCHSSSKTKNGIHNIYGRKTNKLQLNEFLSMHH